MNKVQQQVHEFHRDVIKQPCSPAEPMIRNGMLRARLILEEAVETVVALVGRPKAVALLESAVGDNRLVYPDDEAEAKDSEPNLIEAIDGLADLEYVIAGTAEDIGIDLEPFSDEVHRSNMTKKGGEFRADGKLIKPAWYSPADIKGVLVKIEALHLECERLQREPPKRVNDITADEWRAMSLVEREAWTRYWSQTSAWFSCLGCGFPTVCGTCSCDACRPLDPQEK
jgi:predicted HAD superfamily Cof-like phosphohydrolase